MSENKTGLKENMRVASYFLKLAHKLAPKYIPMVIIVALLNSAAPFINIIFPKYIIDELLGRQKWDILIIYIAVLVGSNAILSLINRILGRKLDEYTIILKDGLELHFGQHIMNMDFESLENPAVLNQKEEAVFYVNNQNVINKLINSIINLFQSIITLIGLLALIFTLSFIVILIILVINLLGLFLLKKAQDEYYKFNETNIPVNRKLGYYTSIESDLNFAKEVRLYKLAPMIINKYKQFNEEFFTSMSKLFRIQAKYNGVGKIFQSVQYASIYSYMIYRVFINSISIGDFTMYINAASRFSAVLANIGGTIVEFMQMSRFLESYVKFKQIPNKMRTGDKEAEIENEYTIVFKNVSFKYPNAADYTLKNINIQIDNNQKVSIVGENGAGKTTFIKLLCRLYDPDEGEILINNRNIKEFDFDSYMKILGVVFQDYKLYAFTVKENIVFDKINDVSDEVIENALEKAGLENKIKSLPNRIYTYIYKIFDEQGTEFSGGESQKLAIARAIYKDTPILILDEPTAALDPYAESEIFTTINKMALNKTTLYISHRLSSCRFCDSIIVFDRGQIIEYGSHDELIEAAGKYKLMWDTQSKYYI